MSSPKNIYKGNLLENNISDQNTKQKQFHKNNDQVEYDLNLSTALSVRYFTGSKKNLGLVS